MRLNELKPPKGSTRTSIRIGRGHGSGHPSLPCDTVIYSKVRAKRSTGSRLRAQPGRAVYSAAGVSCQKKYSLLLEG